MKKNRIRLTESQLHKVIKESVKKVLKEDIDTDNSFDFYDFVKILDNNGYAYSDYYDVKSKDGRIGTRYRIETYPYNNKTTDFETLKQDLINAGGADRFVFSQGTHKYAPEIKSFSIIMFED